MMAPLKAVLGSVFLFGLATLVYLFMLFRGAGQRNAAIGLMTILSKTVWNPAYWIAFAVTLWVGWRVTFWLAR
ncbi:MAG: hypothetical protein ACRD4M_08940 [Candidatus Acidiferrales bacterium]